MSSPQMTRMLGFLSAACVGRTTQVSAAAAASTAAPYRTRLLSFISFCLHHLVSPWLSCAILLVGKLLGAAEAKRSCGFRNRYCKGSVTRSAQYVTSSGHRPAGC